jgi:hypothetical protein
MSDFTKMWLTVYLLATEPEVRVRSLTYQIFGEVVALERGPLSLVSTIEQRLGRQSGGSGLAISEYGCGDPLRWPRNTLYPQNVGTSFDDKQRSLGEYTSLAD